MLRNPIDTVKTFDDAAKWLQEMDQDRGMLHRPLDEQWDVAFQQAIDDLGSSAIIYMAKGSPSASQRELDNLCATLLMLSLRIGRMTGATWSPKSWEDLAWGVMLPERRTDIVRINLVNWATGQTGWVNEAKDVILESLATVVDARGRRQEYLSGARVPRILASRLMRMSLLCGPIVRTAADHGYAGVESCEYWAVEPLREAFSRYYSARLESR